MTTRLAIPGVLSPAQVRATADYVAAQQSADGSIPWHIDGRFDLWDHVEAAMGLTVTGRLDRARAALRWCARSQRPDGSWPANGNLDFVDTNQCAYVAVGVWHFYCVTGELDLLAELWPTVERALNLVVHAQHDDGTIGWAVDNRGSVSRDALLTGCSSILQALECGCLIAGQLGKDRPRWRSAGRALAVAIRERPESFMDKSRFAMDWYYPVLGGAIRGADALARIDGAWSSFAWDGHGCRCVDDQPWVTAAESAELVAALDAVGRTGAAHNVLTDLHSLRDEESGAYWTGRNIPNDTIWPRELATWTSAAVLLAADALTGATGGSSLFRDAGTLWRTDQEDAA